MAEREAQRGTDRSDLDVAVEPVDEPAATTDSGLPTRVRERAGSLFSPRAFGIVTVASLAGMVLVGGALPLGGLADLLGIAVATFVYGALSDARRYAEVGAAGALVGGGAALLDHLVLTLFGLGLPLVALGALGAVLAALLGHYLGSDLRHGLTRDL